MRSRHSTLAMLSMCMTSCFVNATDENVIGTWVSTTDPRIKLIIDPDGTFKEEVGSLHALGRWQIWTHMGDGSTHVEIVGLKHARSSADPNERSGARVKRLPFATKLVVQAGQSTIEFRKQ